MVSKRIKLAWRECADDMAYEMGPFLRLLFWFMVSIIVGLIETIYYSINNFLDEE